MIFMICAENYLSHEVKALTRAGQRAASIARALRAYAAFLFGWLATVLK